jgi:hypothetical protein
MARKSRKPGSSENQSSREQRGLRFDENDLLGQLTAHEGSALWLGRCTISEIQHKLEEAGLLGALREKSLDKLVFRIEPFEEFGQTLRVYCRAVHPDNLIAEARFRETRFTPQRKMPETFSQFAPTMLAIDWLLMQNPFAEFTQERPRLPGQTHPGLGQAHRVTKLLMDLCTKLELAGVLNFPEYFHNAHLYREHFHFYDPLREGIVQALFRDLSELRLADISWAMERGCVRYANTGERFEWIADVQILPMHAVVRDYFVSAWYRLRVQEALAGHAFVLDRKNFEEKGHERAIDLSFVSRRL